MKLTKEEITGFIGSLIFCTLLIFLLYFIVLRTAVKTGEEGVLVNFGTVDWSSGTFEPRIQGPNRVIPQENMAPLPVEPISIPGEAPPAVTQNMEETVAIEAAKKEEEKRQREQVIAEQRRLAEERRIAEEERKRREAIESQVSGAFGVGTSDQSQEGTAQSGAGNQGSSDGNAPTGVYEGVGGSGSFNLVGRSIGAGGLPRPDYSGKEEGRIVVDITVDPQGNVISTGIGKGTNIVDAVMRRSAQEAAWKAKFNAISGTNNQSGTITYNYKFN
jgi:TonB family C-terminal domain